MPLPRKTVWDVANVFNFLRNMSPNRSLGLRGITLKLTMLMALLPAQRIQTLHFLRIDNMKLTSTKVIVVVDSLLKQGKPGNTGIQIVLESYPTEPGHCDGMN